jgi:hypothetical protein
VHRDLGCGVRAVVVLAALSAVGVGARLDRVTLRSLMRARTAERVWIYAELEEPGESVVSGTSRSIEFLGSASFSHFALDREWLLAAVCETFLVSALDEYARRCKIVTALKTYRLGCASSPFRFLA